MPGNSVIRPVEDSQATKLSPSLPLKLAPLISLAAPIWMDHTKPWIASIYRSSIQLYDMTSDLLLVPSYTPACDLARTVTWFWILA
jgi:hypothetical protein